MTKVLIAGDRTYVGKHLAERISAIRDWELTEGADADYVFYVPNGTIEDTLRFLDRRRPSVKKFFYISSASVFGDAPPYTYFDEWAPHNPADEAAADLAAGECFAIAAWRSRGLPLIIARLANDFLRCMPFLKRTVKSYRPSPSRMFTPVENQVDALAFLAQTHEPATPDKLQPSVFNIVGDEEFTVDQMMDMTDEITGVKLERQYWRLPEFVNRREALDGDKLRDLGWTPPFDFHERLAATVHWQQDLRVKEPV